MEQILQYFTVEYFRLLFELIVVVLFFYKWCQSQRAKELKEIVPAAVQLVDDLASLYIASRGKTMPEKVKVFQEHFLRMARERGYTPAPWEITVATTLGSAIHKANKEARTLALEPLPMLPPQPILEDVGDPR